MSAANEHARGCDRCHLRLVEAFATSVLGRSTVASPISPPRKPGSPGPSLRPGTSVGRYTVLALVGHGGMGQVYAAYDPKLDRRVALKLLHVDQQEDGVRAQERLLREAQAVARLSHPNVVVVHDVGTLDERVFVAMEFVEGTTVAEWEKVPRSWREILAVFAQAARGLAAAHDAGIVHRDFKPQNVMVSSSGAVRVMDFGLARYLDVGPAPVAGSETPSRASGELNLTRPGERLGTPRYMAPEQFKGGAVDARTDQFTFCVALYEALYGAHPFDDDSMLSLSDTVSRGALRPPPKTREVPGWLRRAVLRGLATRPEDRHASMAALANVLENDPGPRWRRRLVTAGLVGLAVASLVLAVQTVAKRRSELDGRIADALAEADGRARAARETAKRTRQGRALAFAAFDDRESERGEAVWKESLVLGARADREYVETARAFETALLLDTENPRTRDRAADLALEHLLFAEETGMGERARVLTETLDRIDRAGTRVAAARAPATLDLRVRPATAAVTLERYTLAPVTRRRTAGAPRPIAPGATTLEPGSYRLAIRGEGLAEVFVPFVVSRAERLTLDVEAPPRAAVPDGFVPIPAGRFLYGEADERARRGFLNAVPLHPRSTGPYLIARHETTYREWIAFLEALPAEERERHTPRVSSLTRGAMQLRQIPGGWRLALQPSTRRYEARDGEPIEYVGRRTRARQDWRDFPVTGISMASAERYVAWLAASGRVPGARLCDELEWERAARGADERTYPHGDDLEPDDANVDFTYGRVDTAYGPDVVGAHPTSRSPFGVDDLTGNVIEMVLPRQGDDPAVVRGGNFFMATFTALITNREIVPRTFQDVISGLRVCATPR